MLPALLEVLHGSESSQMAYQDRGPLTVEHAILGSFNPRASDLQPACACIDPAVILSADRQTRDPTHSLDF